jgi:hypothetical protein
MQFVSVTTNATGSEWEAFGSLATSGVDLLNKTGTTLEFRRGGAPTAIMQLPDGIGFRFRVTANLSELEVRRVDQDNAQVTLYGDAE